MDIVWLNHRDVTHPRAGGAERTIHEITSRLSSRGHNVTLYTTRWNGSREAEEIDGVNIKRVGGNVISHFKTPFYTRHFDVVVDDLAHVVPWFSPQMLHKSGTAFFRHLHQRTLSGQVKKAPYKVLSFLERRYPIIYKKWPFVTESKQAILDLIGIGVPEEKIIRILPGVDSDLFTPGPKFDVPTMIYFGGFRDYKRPWEPIRVLEEVNTKAKDARLIYAGNGPSLTFVKERASKSPSGKNIEFRGKVSKLELADLVSRSWLNLHTSKAEGWGLTIIESAAAGTPTVGYRVPGVSESISEGENGILVTDGNAEEMAQVAMDFMVNPNKSSLSSRKYAENFSWSQSTVKWETHLKRVVEGYYT